MEKLDSRTHTPLRLKSLVVSLVVLGTAIPVLGVLIDLYLNSGASRPKFLVSARDLLHPNVEANIWSDRTRAIG
jgi:hypothetical protein